MIKNILLRRTAEVLFTKETGGYKYGVGCWLQNLKDYVQRDPDVRQDDGIKKPSC